MSQRDKIRQIVNEFLGLLEEVDIKKPELIEKLITDIMNVHTISLYHKLKKPKFHDEYDALPYEDADR